MKKYLSWFVALILCTFSLNAFCANTSSHTKHGSHNQRQQAAQLYFFWSQDCPHCVQAHPFLEKLKTEFPGLKINSFEVSTPANQERFSQMAKSHGHSTSFVPTFFIGDRMIVGYSGENSTGKEIRQAIRSLMSAN